MPRDIPVGNGSLLLTFDNRYQIRDIYFPHVGQENHAGAGPCRFGIYADVPRDGVDPQHYGSRLCWSNDAAWQVHQRYLRETLTTSVSLDHHEFRLAMYCNDVVDFHRPVFVRKIKVKNLASHDRLVRLIHHQDFNMFGTKMGDTAYYDPELKSIVHYRGKRYLMVTFFDASAPGQDPADASLQRIDEYAAGTSGFHGAEGTWRDAEDGHLQGNAISQGAVDSTIAFHTRVAGSGERSCYMVIIAGHSREELIEQHKWLNRIGPQGVIDRTTAYWRLWIGGTNINFGNLPPKVVDLFKRSLLIVRTQIDNKGAIVAANDSDIMQFSRDTYSYMWPRDGALVADSLDLAGFPDVARLFYTFCRDVLTPDGYFHHKYNPDGSPASSWHPWVLKGKRAMPIQEDETALVVWALWRHYYRYRDIEFIRPLWVDLVQKAADFMVRYRDPRTGLPLPSYDLWEERWGVHAFTVATVYGGLKAARNFAVCFGDRAKAQVYQQAADEVKAGAAKYLWNEKLGRFSRRLIPKDDPTPPPVAAPAPAAAAEAAAAAAASASTNNAYGAPAAISGVNGAGSANGKSAANHEPVNGQGVAAPIAPPTPAAPAAPIGLGPIPPSEAAPAGAAALPPAAAPVPAAPPVPPEEEYYEVDPVLDASLYAIFKFHLFEADDPRVVATMRQVETKLWVKTRVGGVARYENDYYHRISNDIAAVPGNPWFICTLWLADYYITRASTPAELKLALPIFEWAASHALQSGVLAEQVNPYTNEPISVSPLTWSHATVVSTVIKYLEKLQSLQTCESCNQPVFRLRRSGPVEIKSQFTFDRLEAGFDPRDGREMAASIGRFIKDDPRSRTPLKVTLAIDTRDCIGCEVCVVRCHQNVLRMVDGKALIDLRNLNKCDLNGECVEVCPTDVVNLVVQPVEAAAPREANDLVPARAANGSP